MDFTDSSGASPPFQGFHPPKPTFSRRAAIFDGNRYSDFVTLWRTCHRSRFDAPTPEQCILEQWNNEAATRGIRALDQLREGVEEAIRQLGQGFLTHRRNQQLQQRIRSGELPADQYLHQLLRLVYRMLFLLDE